jgi:hypothetical protein
MNILKKITFAPLLVFSMIAVVILADQMLVDPLNSIFIFSSSSMYQITYLALSLTLVALSFVIIVTLSGSWEIPLFVAGFSSLIPLIMIQQYPVNIILALGFFISFLIGLFVHLQKLASYITFSSKQILAPSIGLVTLLLSITLSVAAYQATSTKIEKEGFSVPDPLIDAALQFSGANSLSSPSSFQDPNVQGLSTAADTTIPQINLSPEQIKFIQQNPQLLQQFGITPEQFNDFVKSQKQPNSTGNKKDIENSPTSAEPTNSMESSDLMKSLVKAQLNKALEPYKPVIGIITGSLLFSTLSFVNYFVGFLTPLLLAFIFWILEKTGFVHFIKEMREVKKLVV